MARFRRLSVWLFLGLALCLVPSAGAETHVTSILADGFDFPVGKPDGEGYYIYRGYWPNGHLGEDWNGRGGGNTDLGDPVYSVGHGVVVYSEDYRKGWGNVVIVRHAYRDPAGKIRYVDSLYGHLHKRAVRLHQKVRKGQLIGTIGTAHGRYTAHLHFEMRHELRLGMDRTLWPKDNRCYYSPKKFIAAHRRLTGASRQYPIPVNTFRGQVEAAASGGAAAGRRRTQ
ncbi:MAG TPA: M23 family metallopeptidase [Verrucomicrobiales bacterium]|nr:M23 family metallopeptidase [Verrucomicrobiales bacterium]